LELDEREFDLFDERELDLLEERRPLLPPDLDLVP
jgi:hypothetical protein